MLKILWKRGKIAPEEQFLPLSAIFYYLMLDFYVKTGIRFSLRDKQLFDITEVEITRVDCSSVCILYLFSHKTEFIHLQKHIQKSRCLIKMNLLVHINLGFAFPKEP